MSTRLGRFTIHATAVFLGAPLPAQTVQWVSAGVNGVPTNGNSYSPAISTDGRYVAFGSSATNLIPGDTNGASDVFVWDRSTGIMERISVDSAGVQANDGSGVPSISADGRYVAFSSSASNLVPGDTNASSDVFLRDRQSGTTIRVSVAADGSQANADCSTPSISADGRYVAFWSLATNLVPGDTNGVADLFVRDLQALTTDRVSVATDGSQADLGSYDPSLSADGRYVAFDSWATNLVAGDTNAHMDVFVRDRQLGTTIRASVSTLGGDADDDSFQPTISAGGRFLTFWSPADDLVPGDTNGYADVFLRDLQGGTTELVSVGYWGQGNGNSWQASSVSDDGRYVAFVSQATNFGPTLLDYRQNVFLHDRQTGHTDELSRDRMNGFPKFDGDSYGPPPITPDGRFVAFATDAGDLVPEDSDNWEDIYLYDPLGTTSFTSLCDPGIAGVIACPCGNPPSGPGRGCDNSAATGGASLSAQGAAYLTSDTLQFMTSGEKPTATSVVLQGTSSPAAGAVYGQGVRCVGGTLKRLYTKAAYNGGIFVPSWGVDPPVSARSAAKGDPISPGQNRWYLVFYRDPIVLGGCPAGSTFNATQTGLVSWAP